MMKASSLLRNGSVSRRLSFLLLVTFGQLHEVPMIVVAFQSSTPLRTTSQRNPIVSSRRHPQRLHVGFGGTPHPRLTNSTLNESVAGWHQQQPVRSNFANDIRVMAPAVFGLTKAMVGTGMLALPLGLAVITDHPSGLWPANAIMSFLCILSAYTFGLYGRLTDATQATSLGELWKIIIHRDTSWIVSLANFVYCFGCCLAYSLVCGDIFSSLLQGSAAHHLPAWLVSRRAAILGVTTGIVLPLCHLQSLTALAPLSVVGVVGTLFTTAFLGFRCPAVVATSPYAQPASSFGTYARFASPAPLILVAMSCVAMMGHFSAPDFYHSLKESRKKVATRGGGVLRDFLKVTAAGFGAVGIINALTLAFGFLTFGGSCQGNILSNFSVTDVGANISRLLIGISVIGGFPMCIRPCRSAALELLGKAPTAKNKKRAMRVVLASITGVALAVKDVGFVISLNGAVMGSNLIYTIPCLLFLKQSKNGTGRRLRLERILCRLLVGFGLTAMVAGTGASIISAFFPHLLN